MKRFFPLSSLKSEFQMVQRQHAGHKDKIYCNMDSCERGTKCHMAKKQSQKNGIKRWEEEQNISGVMASLHIVNVLTSVYTLSCLGFALQQGEHVSPQWLHLTSIILVLKATSFCSLLVLNWAWGFTETAVNNKVHKVHRPLFFQERKLLIQSDLNRSSMESKCW